MKRLFDTENPNPSEFKIGDIICTYNAGFHVLINIKHRFCTHVYHDSYHKSKPDMDPNRLNVGEYSPNFMCAKIDPGTGKITIIHKDDMENPVEFEKASKYVNTFSIKKYIGYGK